MSITKAQNVLIKFNESNFIGKYKKEILSVLKVLATIWLFIACLSYFTLPDQTITASPLFGATDYLRYTHNALIAGSVISMLSLTFMITYEHLASKVIVLGNFILIMGILLSIQLSPVQERQKQRYEQCLNGLMHLDDEAKNIAVARAVSMSGISKGMALEKGITSCFAEIDASVSRINTALYSGIKPAHDYSIAQIAALSSKPVKGFTLAEEDQMVSCLNQLLEGDAQSRSSANWILNDLVNNGLNQTPQQYIVQCQSNVALAHGKLAKNKMSLAEMLAAYKRLN